MPVGKIVATVIANTANFTAGMKKVAGTAKRVGAGVGRASKAIAKIGIVAIAAGAAIVTALVVKGLKAIDAQAKLARSMGATQRGLVGLQRAAEDAGLSKEKLAKSAQKLNRKLGEAQELAGPASEALDKLGLSAAELSAMDVDERFAAISDAMVDANMTTAQMAFTLGDLGLTAKEMTLLMEKGGDTIRNATLEMEAFGVTMDEVSTSQVESANDAWDRLGLAQEGLANVMAVEVAPIIQKIAELFTDASKESGGFKDTVKKAFDFIVSAVGGVGDAVMSIGLAWRQIEHGALTAVSSIIKFAADAVFAYDQLTRSIADGVNTIIRASNKLPFTVKVDELRVNKNEVLEIMNEMSQTVADMVVDSQKELDKLADATPFSAMAKQWVEDARKASREAAEAAVEEQRKQRTRANAVAAEGLDAEAQKRQEAAQKEMDRRRAVAETNLANLRGFLRSELEEEAFAHQIRLKQLDEAHALMLISDADFRATRKSLEKEFNQELSDDEKQWAKDLEKFTASSWQKKVGIVVGALGQMAGQLDSSNRTMFNIQKTAAIASAIVSTYQGAAKALAVYPPPLSFAMAGAQVAAGLAQVAAIKSQTFGGGGGGGGAAGATVGASAVASTGGGGGGGSSRELVVSGIQPEQLYTGAVLSGLAEELIEFQRQGGSITLKE